MKKILITGASGFIGRHAISYLLSDENEIHVITRNSHLFPSKVKVHQADLFNDHEVSHLLSTIKPSHLLHLAWYAVPSKFWSSEINLDCVKSSIKLFQEFVSNGGKRLVVAGTCAEYEWGPHPCDEITTPLKPSTFYGICKASLYQLLEAYAKQKHLSFAWGRIFFLYGPHEYKERLVPSIIQKLLNHENAPCSHGNQFRDFLHVEDVARAFVDLLNCDIQGPINIASGQCVTLKQVINAIATKLNGPEKIQYGAIAAPSDPPIIAAQVNRIHEELKWSPKYSIDEGLNQTIAWWKKQSKITHS